MVRRIHIKECQAIKGIFHPNSIEIGKETDSLPGGNFGKIYPCLKIDNAKSPKPYLIKILAPEHVADGYPVVSKLIETLDSYTGWKSVREMPGLRAAPLICFNGVLDNSEVSGYVMEDLRHNGFESLEKTEDRCREGGFDYPALPNGIKLRFCYYLAEAMEVLEKSGFIHADINPQNIFVNIRTGELALIDFDSGTFTHMGVPSTNGKLTENEWRAPEALQTTTHEQLCSIDHRAELWSVCIAFHYLFFLATPFYFLKQFTYDSASQFLSVSSLRHPNAASSLIDSSRVEYLGYLRDMALSNGLTEKLLGIILQNCAQSFFLPDERITARQWVAYFSDELPKPKIDFFKPSYNNILMGGTVLLTWNASSYEKLYLDNGAGNVSGRVQISVSPVSSMIYTLTATGAFGFVQASAQVNVMPFEWAEKKFESTTIPVPVIRISSQPKIHLDRTKLVQLQLNKMNISIPSMVKLKNMNIQKPNPFRPSISGISVMFNRIKKQIISKL